MVELSWTFEQVMKAQEISGDQGPASPLFQWNALHQLEELKAKFASGDKFSLMLALRICANHDLVMPEWVWRAYIKAFDSVLNYRVGSWDEAFGRPNPAGAHLQALRDRHMKALPVYRFCEKKIEEGAAVDAALFEAAGHEFGVSGSTAKNYYYESKKKWGAVFKPGAAISKKIKKTRKYKAPAKS